MSQKQRPEADWTAYGAIIGVSIVLCAAWLITGSLWLTLIILILGLLHIAKDFPAAEAIVSQDPILVWLRKASPVIVIAIFGVTLLGNWLR
jgi:uncharacterized membrane protein